MSSAPAPTNASDDNTGDYASRTTGTPNTPDHRVYITHPDGRVLSAVHDVPLYGPSNTNAIANHDTSVKLHMVVESPRWTNAQMHLELTEAHTPIAPVVRNARPTYVRSFFPHHGYLWNYGALPQTYLSGAPLRVCELGTRVASTGDVRCVRVLGLLAPREEGVLRYAVLAVDTADALAPRLHTLADVERECPGMISATREWFKLYKITEGKDPNTFEFGGEAQGAEVALRVVRECHAAWQRIFPEGGGNDDATGDPLVLPDSGEVPAAPMRASATKWWFLGRGYR
ncbi:inorganic pyrophosphatase [Mycena rebaudengoi]|nr:inorganic pyrophosphatase [Mycena rebaudengoi]